MRSSGIDYRFIELDYRTGLALEKFSVYGYRFIICQSPDVLGHLLEIHVETYAKH